MVSLLQWLVDFFEQLVCWIMTALVGFMNLVILALGTLLVTLIELLPDMPEEVPSTPEPVEDVVGWINWFFPVSAVAQFLAFIISAWILWQAVALVMRWAKAKDG